MTSPSLLDRISSPRNRLPILPLHASSARPPSEYPLDELDPRPDDTLTDLRSPRPRLQRPTQRSPRRLSPASSIERKMAATGHPRVLFSGPPPPIASSAVITNHTAGHSRSSSRGDRLGGNGLISASRFGFESSLIGHRHHHEADYRQDSTWRSFRRREKVLERDIQKLLDLQASGLLAGSRDGASERSLDRDSDGGESTFYSAATSKSRMSNSLYVPPRSTSDGNVIPVRQPAPKKPVGIGAARAGLRRSMAALSQLKAEEGAHLEAALTQRKDALACLDKMVARKDNIYAELHSLEEDEEEPLGRELRELGTEHEVLNEEIRILEEKIVGMRNRRRWVKERIEDVKNRRESGLSGYRAAGRDIDADIQAVLQRPPITPLDLEALSAGWGSGKDIEPPGGQDFLKLRPERRTAEMARSWWEGEMAILQRRRKQISEDREALVEGTEVWSEVTQLVAAFESNLRGLLKTAQQARTDADDAAQRESVRGSAAKMDAIVKQLEERMALAEKKRWNLLICAIGAELEAFFEAQAVLKATIGLPPDDDGEEEPHLLDGSHSTVRESQADRRSSPPPGEDHNGESDNEVPADLLVSKVEDHDQHDEDSSPSPPHPDTEGEDESSEVPAEFLAEHELFH